MFYIYSITWYVVINLIIKLLGFNGIVQTLGAAAVTYLLYKIKPEFFGHTNDNESHYRGAKIVSSVELTKKAKIDAKNKPNPIEIGTVPVPHELENRHFLFAGTTGSGKSQSFYQVAETARKRNDAAVIPDINGEFTARFYRPGVDVLLSAFDTRSPAWSPLAEMSGIWDSDRISKSIIPDGEGGSSEWNHYAQVILSAVLNQIWQHKGTNNDLTHYLMYCEPVELAELCSATEASRMFSDGNERMLSSILSIVASYAKPLSHLDPTAGVDAFSITKFVQENADQKNGKWLFMPVRDDMFRMLSPLISAQTDISISALLSASDDEKRRVWFFVDEFATWGKIDGVEPLLTKSRKKGGCAVLGLQSISQVRDKYGREKSQTLLSNCGNWLTLRAGDADTSEWMSKNIGDEEIRRFVSSSSNSAQGSTSSESEQFVKQRAVMPAELQTLEDLVGILNIAGPLPAGWVTIPICKIDKTINAFELKPVKSKSIIKHTEIAKEDFDLEDSLP